MREPMGEAETAALREALAASGDDRHARYEAFVRWYEAVCDEGERIIDELRATEAVREPALREPQPDLFTRDIDGNYHPFTVCEHEGRDAEVAGLPTSIADLLVSPDLPPLPWTSPALLVPWPDDAADDREIRDATGRSVRGRNWRESAAALRLMVLAANYVGRLAPRSTDKPEGAEG